MAPGAGRRAGAWMMLASAVCAAAGVMLVGSAVGAFEEQVADLDPNESRAVSSAVQAAWGLALVSFGVLAFVVSWITFGVGSHRARKHGVETDGAHTIVAGIAGAGLVFVLLFAFLAPGGPLALAAGMATGGGGPAGAVQLETYEGNLTTARFSQVPGAAGPLNAENVHAFQPVAAAGTLKMRLVSGGAPEGTFAMAVLEERTSAGGWQEIARTEPAADSEVTVPQRGYPGELRFVVRLPDGELGQVQYLLAVSFDPATR